MGGAATNMIYGIALGYKSVIIPVIVLAGAVYGSFSLCDMYGVSLAAIGMLSNLATGLTIDVYGPVCDNAGGIAEMAELESYVRTRLMLSMLQETQPLLSERDSYRICSSCIP